MKPENYGIDCLLALDGEIIEQLNGFWVKIDAKSVEVSLGRPHGVKYSLSLHSESGNRVLGFDNAHPISEGRGYHHRYIIEYDHEHKMMGKIVPYEYHNAEQLMVDFWTEVDKAIDLLGS